MFREGCICYLCQGGEDIDSGYKAVGDTSFGDHTSPHHDTGYTLTTFKSSPFSFTVTGGVSRMITVVEPGTVIGSEDHQCTFIQSHLFQCLYNLSYAPVDFHHHVAETPLL
ncbi:hypothetical protein SDC9_192807 [bioreactor metagenome]|uniref:Uncharacterized protein n=1 Tax=bioreactor metagenome TaxID=1076179 RepID=A0A645I254_9ZZZZ